MNNIQIFENSEFGQVRTMTDEKGEPWFVGKDVADALGYEAARNAIAKHVDDEDKLTHQISASGQTRTMTIINESGLYSLVMSSQLESAKRFKRWVTSEVLPTIRRTGGYIPHGEKDTDADIMAKALMIAHKTLELKAERIATLEAKAEEDRPKVVFAEAVAVAENCILIGELAKLLCQNGIETGQNRLFKTLMHEGYLMRSSGQYMPTQRATELGLFRVKETVIQTDGKSRTRFTVKVTGKGQTYFIDKFQKNAQAQMF